MLTTLNSNFLRAVAVILTWLASSASATTPLSDILEIDGQQGVFQGWLQLPSSDVVDALRRSERCSAWGGPRGNFRVEGGRLWLDSLYRCSGKIEIKEMYPDKDAHILATWITGNFVAEVGKPVCWSNKAYNSIYETQISMQVQEGVVISLQRKSNIDHPDCRRAAP